MIRAFFLRLRRDESGSVITEFAIWAAALFLVIMSALDFGGYYIARSAINEAISAASIQAFQKDDKATLDALPAYVRNLAGDQSLAVTLSCNGVANSCTHSERTCACLANDGSYVAAETCESTCGGSGMTSESVAGYYLTIKASKTYQPLLVPQGMLAGTALDQATTVRLQ